MSEPVVVDNVSFEKLRAEADVHMRAYYYLQMSVVKSDDEYISNAAISLCEQLRNHAQSLKSKLS